MTTFRCAYGHRHISAKSATRCDGNSHFKDHVNWGVKRRVRA